MAWGDPGRGGDAAAKIAAGGRVRVVGGRVRVVGGRVRVVGGWVWVVGGWASRGPEVRETSLRETE